MSFPVPTLPFATPDFAPLEGAFRERPEDFCVEEIPAYLPSGEGEHLYLRVEKRGHTTDEVAAALSRYLRVPRSEIGYAGQKDRDAITVQYFSVPVAAGQVEAFRMEGVAIEPVGRHTNRIKTGHLAGNRFRILLRDAPPEQLDAARQIAALLSAKGLPNAFGLQRFGREGRTAADGFALLADPRGGPGARDRFRRKLLLSAAQAWLYNRYLQRRHEAGDLRRVLPGDVARRTDSGGLFLVEDLDREQARLDAGEIDTTGPIYGRKTFSPAGEAARREAEVLVEAGLSPAVFDAFGKLAMGTRRPNLLRPEAFTVEATPEGLLLSFALPSGAYATLVVAELLKRELR